VPGPPPPGSAPKPMPSAPGLPPPHNAPPPPQSSPGFVGGRPPLSPSVPTNPIAMPPPSLQQPETFPTAVMPRRPADGPAAPAPLAAAAPPPAIIPTKKDDEEEATMVAAVPQEVLARAIGEAQNPDELEWPNVYEEFVKTKKSCNEPTEGLTFDKFRQTLRKNRDALVQRHNCKRVKFTVYVKDGRASLKATPIKD
jgi:hypothetical protein